MEVEADAEVDAEAVVGAVLDRVRARLRTPPACGVAHVDVLVVDALRPGKLLRPELVVRSAAATAGGLRAADLERTVAGALAVELLHVATLVHDDVIDEAPRRRGRPSVVAAAGVGTAIVVGDLLLARGAAAAAAAGPAAIAAWSLALERMAAGQLREELLALAPSVEEHAEYVALKTGSLFRTSAEIGALCAGAAPDVVAAHGRFGHHVGMAFQHVDDLLDLVGDPVRLGKPVALDAANGVPTAAALLGGRTPGRSGAGDSGDSGDSVDAVDAVARLVAAELEAARAALPTSTAARTGPDLAGWAAGALLRALRGGVGPEGLVATRRLLDVLHDLGPLRARAAG